MNNQTSVAKNYTITEAAKISGLPESTLRYYEKIGLINPINRDYNTKRRVYSDDDINNVIGVACLNAIGLSIDEMRQYKQNWQNGRKGADDQVELLSKQVDHIKIEIRLMQLRLQYIENKVDYWKAIGEGDVAKSKVISERVYAVAREMNLPIAMSKK